MNRVVTTDKTMAPTTRQTTFDRAGKAVAWTSLWRRGLLALMAALTVLGVSTTTASAAGGDFNYSLSYSYRYYFGNCTIITGPVVDPYGTAHGFAVIGGGRVNCTTPHTFTTWTQEFYSRTGAAGTYYQAGIASTTFTNSYGFGNRILQTGRICGTGYWFTRVTVSANGYSALYFDSPARWVPATGRSASAC